MAEMFKKYFADVYGVSGDDMDAYARKFENMDGPLRVAPFLGEEPDGARQRFIVLYDERQNDLHTDGKSAYLQDMKVCLGDFFDHKKVKLTKITPLAFNISNMLRKSRVDRASRDIDSI